MSVVGVEVGADRPHPGLAMTGARLRAVRNRTLARAARRRRHLVKVVLFGLGCLWFATSITVTTYAAADSVATAADVTDILTALFALVAIAGFIGASSTSLQALYLASDLAFLRTLPLPGRVLFSLKLADAMVGQILPAIILVAVLTGYLLARAERWILAVPAALLIGLLTLVGMTALAMAYVALVGRYVKPGRAGRVLVVTSLAVVILTWIGYLTVVPDLAPLAPGTHPGVAISGPLAAAGAEIAWSPPGWAARAVVAAAEGAPVSLALAGGFYALLIACLVGIANVAVRGMMFGEASEALARPFAPPLPDRPLGRWVATALRALPGPFAALIFKEWLTMFRDPRRLSGAVWPLGMVIVYTVVLSRDDAAAPTGAPGLTFWLRCAGLALLPWGASLGIAIYAFGTEGRQVYLLRTLPISPRVLFWAKALANLVPVLVLALTAAILVGAFQGAERGQYLALLGLVAWAATGYTLIDTATAAISPSFAAEQVQRTTTISGRLVGFAVGGLFTLASGIAALRLIFMATGVPDSMRAPLTWSVGGIVPLGWPLVLTAAAAALLTVLLFVQIAERRVAAMLAAEVVA